MGLHGVRQRSEGAEAAHAIEQLDDLKVRVCGLPASSVSYIVVQNLTRGSSHMLGKGAGGR